MAPLDQQRARLQDDLRGIIGGEVFCDALHLALYATDASIYQIQPLAVVRPRSTADVVACVQYAAEHRIPVHARGAGTGVAGESLGPGLVLDFSKYLRRILRLENDTVRVQPGVVHERLNGYLRRFGRMFGPDPATSHITTIGGMVGVDASGSRWLRYGSTRQHVLTMQVVLADGQVIEVGREPLDAQDALTASPGKHALVQRLAEVLVRAQDLIAQHRPKSRVNRCGYQLEGVLSEQHLDLPKLLVGSEGTLALTTEVVLATQPIPRARGVTLLLFDSLDRAARAVPTVLTHDPTACDLLDRRHLSLARDTEVHFDLLIPREAEAALLVEIEGDGTLEVRDRLYRLVDDVRDRRQLAFGARQALDRVEVELFWRIVHRIQPALYRAKGPQRPVPVIEDVAVPPETLPDFLVRVHNLLKRHQVTATLFAHAGHGQLHVEPLLDLSQPDHVQRMCRLAEDYYEEVLQAGGTISAEHGCGLSRTPFVRRQYGELYDVFRQIKQIFDPRQVLNPGKIVGDDSALLVRHLRPAIELRGPGAPEPESADQPSAAPPLRHVLETQLDWNPAQVADIVRQCNGCGQCRSQAADVRMCPLFRVHPTEEASPRAKANLLRAVLTGQLDLASLTSDEFKAIADLCVHCHMCPQECPAGVDIPRLMSEGKGAYVAAHHLAFHDWVLARLDLLAALAGLAWPVANWALGSRLMRWVMEKTLGIAQGRKLARLAPRSFLRWAARRRLTRPLRRSGPKVAYFVDLYANYHDPELAEALVAVLEHNGVAVYVPPEQRQAGIAAIASGALDLARRLARHNATILAEAVRQGYHVVTAEPAVALCLKREYPALLDDEDVRLVARNSSEVCTYLWKLHTSGALQLDLKPLSATVGYHMPCRLKALDVGSPGENLLRLIPGLNVRNLGTGCSGMAGTFGLKRENYRASLRAGWPLISRLRDPTIQAGTTECSACKLQMEQGTTKPTVHPVKLLALAYGLLPDGASPLGRTSQELIVT